MELIDCSSDCCETDATGTVAGSDRHQNEKADGLLADANAVATKAKFPSLEID